MDTSFNVQNIQQDARTGVPSVKNSADIFTAAAGIAERHLRKAMQKMFDNADDTLFDYADKAKNNQQQLDYFDAMRDFRLRRTEIEKVFFDSFRKFNSQSAAGVQPAWRFSGEVQAPASMDQLTLVAEDDLEQSLAITNMITKAHAMFRERLYAMAGRFDYMLEGANIHSRNTPLSPEVVCNAYGEAVVNLPLSLEIKLIILKLFDKFVVSALGAMYGEVNDMLVGVGILPVIKAKAPVNVQGYHRNARYIEDEVWHELGIARPNAAQSDETAASDFDMLRSLFAAQAGAMTSSRSDNNTFGWLPKSVAAKAANDPHNTPQFYIKQDILNGLSALQASFNLQSLADNQQLSSETLKLALVNRSVPQNGDSATVKGIERSESDVIDIVSMMFDFILDDKTLSKNFRNLIARLQIPFIKIAMLDKSFFNNKQHPARQLLNELANTGSCFDSEALEVNGELYQYVETLVQRVVDEFDTDLSLFDELLSELLVFIDGELASDKLAEQMLEQTKQKVADEIEKRVRMYRMPVVVYKFIINEWKDVLTTIGVRDAREGAAWRAALDTVDDLIWSVQPKLIVSERNALIKMIPSILNGLQDGLMLIGYGQPNIESFIKELEALHHGCLRGMRASLSLQKREAFVKHVSAKTQASAGNSNVNKMDAASVLFAEPAQLVEMDYTDCEVTALDDVPESWKNNSVYLQVKQMQPGAWVEFCDADKIRRGKLSWKCEFTGDYTFIDRKFKVVADLHFKELIRRLQNGKAAIVDDVPLFDRAVKAVVKSVKQLLDGASTAKPAYG